MNKTIKEEHKLKLNHLHKTFVIQRDFSDCGIACLLSIIRYYNNFNYSLEQLRDLSGTSKTGTSMLGIHHACKSIGFKAIAYEGDIEGLKKITKPVMLHVILNNRINHYILCYRIDDNNCLVGDPSKGIHTMSIKELESIWVSKRLLSVCTSTREIYIYSKAFETRVVL